MSHHVIRFKHVAHLPHIWNIATTWRIMWINFDNDSVYKNDEKCNSYISVKVRFTVYANFIYDTIPFSYYQIMILVMHENYSIRILWI